MGSPTSLLRIRSLIALIIVIPLALAMKYYSGPGQWWLNNWGSSFGYEIFFMLIAFIVVPRYGAVTAIAIYVCVGTCALEFLQLWKHPWLEVIRSYYLGRTILGNQFCWGDFPAYPIGCLLGWLLLHRIAAFSKKRSD